MKKLFYGLSVSTVLMLIVSFGTLSVWNISKNDKGLTLVACVSLFSAGLLAAGYIGYHYGDRFDD